MSPIDGPQPSAEAQARIDHSNNVITRVRAKLVKLKKSKPELDWPESRIGSIEQMLQDLVYKTNTYKDIASAFPRAQSLEQRAKEIDELMGNLTREVNVPLLTFGLFMRKGWNWCNQDWKHRLAVGLVLVVAYVGLFSIVHSVVSRKMNESLRQSNQTTVGNTTTEVNLKLLKSGLPVGWIVVTILVIVIILLAVGGFVFYYKSNRTRKDEEEKEEGVDEKKFSGDKDLEAEKSQIDAKQCGESQSDGTITLTSFGTAGSTEVHDNSDEKSDKQSSLKDPETQSEKSTPKSITSTGSSSVTSTN